jgi:hypothetical protein
LWTQAARAFGVCCKETIAVPLTSNASKSRFMMFSPLDGRGVTVPTLQGVGNMPNVTAGMKILEIGAQHVARLKPNSWIASD